MPTEGRLIALEGALGPNVAACARALVEDGKGGISSWDASGIFWELRYGDPRIPQPSPRTLVLLYAADLLFRLRWEIRPALEEGSTVVAAPYVDTAVAFGCAAGLERGWLVELFRFAPQPDAWYRVKEPCGTVPCACRSAEGFLEFSCAALRASFPGWEPARLRRRFLAHLDAIERERAYGIVMPTTNPAATEETPPATIRSSYVAAARSGGT